MAFITISGEPGCRREELARAITKRLQCDVMGEAQLAGMMAAQFGAPRAIPDAAWPAAAASILLKAGASDSLIVVLAVGGELLFPHMPGVLRVRVAAPESHRVGNLMLDCGLDRQPAQERLRVLEREEKETLKRRFGKRPRHGSEFDLVFNAASFTNDSIADLVQSAVHAKNLMEAGTLAPATEAKIQFQVRLQLAKNGIAPPDRAQPNRKEFGHPSEEVFANLLDFYRIAWDYEPRSFPLQWDKDGNVLEAFTPDFYLPDFDLYVELTTMKQANVTKKNRKVRLLRSIYPHVNIQVFYQKDVQDLVIKYGLPERLAR